MSFETLRYLTDAANTGRVRIGDESVPLAGDEPAGPAIPGFWLYKSGSKRSTGFRCRYITIRTEDGPPTPSGAQPYLFADITILTKAEFDEYAPGQTVTYKGDSWEVVNLSNEG